MRGQYLCVAMYLLFFIPTFTFLIIIITVTQLVYQFSFLVILGVPLLYVLFIHNYILVILLVVYSSRNKLLLLWAPLKFS